MQRFEAGRDDLGFGYDIAQAAERQRAFLWQVSGPKYVYGQFLRAGVDAYVRFLHLRRADPTQFIVPTYQIDLMWHTHMLLGTQAYLRDTQEMCGTDTPLGHDDSVNDRSSADTKLNVSTQQTKDLWVKTYGFTFDVDGGMYRGEPPPDFFLRRFAIMPAHHPNFPDFKAANPKIPRSRENPNPQQPGYIFGNGAHGLGYYSLASPVSDALVHTRLQAQVRMMEQKRNQACCVAFFPFCWVTLPCALYNTATGDNVLWKDCFQAPTRREIDAARNRIGQRQASMDAVKVAAAGGAVVAGAAAIAYFGAGCGFGGYYGIGAGYNGDGGSGGGAECGAAGAGCGATGGGDGGGCGGGGACGGGGCGGGGCGGG
eukprot:g6114.t1